MSLESDRPRRFRRRAAAVLLGLLSAALLGEVVVRLAVPAYEPRVADYTIAPIPGEPPSWVYAPGSTVTFTWDGDPLDVLPRGARQEVAVNALGLRGRIPGPAERAVVVLGDSFTFGEGVEDDGTFVARLDAAWRERGVRFLNAGVAGHGTVQEAVRLEALLDAFRPLAVVVVHVPNDAVPWDASAARGPDLLNVEPPSGSRLVGIVRSMASAGDVERWYLSYYEGEHAEHGAVARSALVWMAEECARRGVRFGVVAFPLLHRLSEDPLAAVTEHVAAAARESAAPFLDLTPHLAVHPDRELWAHPADRHPNTRAHAVAADAMEPFVEELLR